MKNPKKKFFFSYVILCLNWLILWSTFFIVQNQRKISIRKRNNCVSMCFHSYFASMMCVSMVFLKIIHSVGTCYYMTIDANNHVLKILNGNAMKTVKFNNPEKFLFALQTYFLIKTIHQSVEASMGEKHYLGHLNMFVAFTYHVYHMQTIVVFCMQKIFSF